MKGVDHSCLPAVCAAGYYSLDGKPDSEGHCTECGVGATNIVAGTAGENDTIACTGQW